MFDVGFWELVLCAVVALIVLGPERMPVAVRSVAHWLGAARSMLNAVKAEFEQKLREDKAFAADPNARLEFFYRRHPSWDERYQLYPVLRVDTAP